MLTVVLIGLIGGLITGISPCVLPVLPIVFMSGGVQSASGGGRPSVSDGPRGRRPYLIVLGLVLSFSLFTLLGTIVVDALPIPTDTFRWIGLAALVVLGIATMFPAFDELLQRPFSRLRSRPVDPRRGGLVLGLALGLVYVPCAGPVLAAITVAGATGHIGVETVVLTAAFAVGAGLPLLVLALAGRGVADRVKAVRRRQRPVRYVAGGLLLALAVALALNVTDVLQRAVPDYTASLNRDVARHDVQQHLAGQDNGPVQPALLSACAQQPSSAPADCGPAPGFPGISTWLNTPGGKPVNTKGHVVLVDFWAYSCINCQRAIPHVEEWYRAYRRDGLIVVGVHTPEYTFERSPSNVAAGARRLGVTYPIAIDDDYGTWNAFHNDSWPAEYLIDQHGRIRHVAIGEGDYDTSEQLIRALLQKARPSAQLGVSHVVPDTTPTDAELSPETYLGYERAQYFAGTRPAPGVHSYALPGEQPDYTFAIGGRWKDSAQYLRAMADARLRLRFRAQHVYLDVAGTGTITVDDGTHVRRIAVRGAPDIYEVFSAAQAQHGQVDLSLSPGLQAYSFTFG